MELPLNVWSVLLWTIVLLTILAAVRWAVLAFVEVMRSALDDPRPPVSTLPRTEPGLPPPSARVPHHHVWTRIEGTDRVRCGICKVQVHADLILRGAAARRRAALVRQQEGEVARTLGGQS